LAILLLALVPAALSPQRARAESVDLPPKAKEPFIGRIVFNGNRSFSDKDLRRQMKTAEAAFFVIFKRPRLDRETLRRDTAALEAFYRANGFLDAKVALEKLELLENGTFVDIVISIDEGEPTRVDVVGFQGTGPVSEEKLSKDLRLKPGVPFNPSLVSADIYAMKRDYFDKGYLAVEIDDSVAVDGKSVRLLYRVEPGPVFAIRRIEIKGNRLTKPHIIKREVVFKEGDTFRLSKAIETQRNLFETGLFTEAEIVPENLDTEARTVDVTVRVRERKSAYFEVGFGVGNILGSRVTGEWGDRNMFGRGKRLRLKAEYSFGLFEGGVVDFKKLDPRMKYYRYDAEFGQRHILGTRFLLGINAFLERDATVEPIVIRTRGAAIAAARHLSPRTDLTLRLSDERIERDVPETGTEKSHSRLVASAVSRDTRDFVLDPRKGGYRDLRLELAGGVLGGDNDFYTLNTSLQKYWPKRRSTVLALRARVGFADAYGASKDTGVPVENRYFTGGGNSVRGFKENSLGPREPVTSTAGDPMEVVVGGRFLLVGNAEVRFPIPYFSRYRFSAAAFADAGNVWRSLGSVDIGDFRPFVDKANVTENDFRYSLGVGIRYNTPVGPIRLDFGVPLKRDETDKFGRFHLSLGQIF
jgi:outer membrane protein insertion porin family